jgi:hypothetical protein
MFVALPLTVFIILVVVYRSQKYIWNIDMKDKASRKDTRS